MSEFGEHGDAMNQPSGATPGHLVELKNDGELANITVTRGSDGRVFNLGKPTSPLFPLRLRFYKFQRRHEFGTEEGSTT